MKFLEDDFSLSKVVFSCLSALAFFAVFMSIMSEEVTNSIGTLELTTFERVIPRVYIYVAMVLIAILTIALLFQKEFETYYATLAGFNLIAIAILLITEEIFETNIVIMVYALYITLFVFVKLYLKHAPKYIPNRIVFYILEALVVFGILGVCAYFFALKTRYDILAGGIVFSAMAIGLILINIGNVREKEI